MSVSEGTELPEGDSIEYHATMGSNLPVGSSPTGRQDRVWRARRTTPLPRQERRMSLGKLGSFGASGNSQWPIKWEDRELLRVARSGDKAGR